MRTKIPEGMLTNHSGVPSEHLSTGLVVDSKGTVELEAVTVQDFEVTVFIFNTTIRLIVS